LIISGERTIGYDEIHARIARAATGFRALGLRDGAPVAMMLRNDSALSRFRAARPRWAVRWCQSTGI
jgi:long-chain acyl-CoA synthetase